MVSYTQETTESIKAITFGALLTEGTTMRPYGPSPRLNGSAFSWRKQNLYL